MTYAVPRLRGLLFDGLPEDVKPSVVSLDRFWFTDEAASVIARSAAMVSIEQHAPIIAIASGVPAILLCQPIPSIRRKGQMWPDLGMERWFFESTMNRSAHALWQRWMPKVGCRRGSPSS